MTIMTRLTNWLAQRALHLHVLKACAVIATLYAKATAALKRGSGQAQPQGIAINCTGRFPQPEGGDLNSLCCAAAGIFALDAKAHARAVYPTTGVRAAQKLSPSLRSQIRPHAQLAKGYTHLSATNDSGNAPGYLIGKMVSKPIKLLVQSNQSRPLPWKGTDIHNVLGNAGTLIKDQLQLKQPINHFPLWHVGELEVIRCNSRGVQSRGRKLCRCSKRIARLVELFTQQLNRCQPSCSQLVKGSIYNLFSLGCSARCRQPGSAGAVQCRPGSNRYSANTTYRLNPVRSAHRQPSDANPVPYRSNKQPRACTANHQPPQRPYRPLNHFWRDTLFHWPASVAKLLAPSLPPSASLVHGVAA